MQYNKVQVDGITAPAGASVFDPAPNAPEDPRYSVSGEEAEYVLRYKNALSERGLLDTEVLQEAAKEFSEIALFEKPTQDELDMRRDEDFLGIPHKDFPLSPEEEKQRFQRVSLQIESFYSEQGTGIETFSDEDLKKYLNNVTANLSYISDLEPYLDKEGDKRKLVEKTISLVVHLRKKAIAELIRRGLR